MGDVVQIGGQRVILAVGSRKRSIVSDGDADIGRAGKVRRLEKRAVGEISVHRPQFSPVAQVDAQW